MNDHQSSNLSQLQAKMQEVHQLVFALAQAHRDDSIALLALLRALELLHRSIQTEIFQDSLPNTRHDLYNLLRDIEETGGWPYIERMRLRALMEGLPLEGSESE
jgi:hypothetical protein